MIVVMGVSGSGKTTVGKELAAKLDLPFYDADDFHSQTSIEKMKSGTPLTDPDRYPWLQLLSEKIERWNTEGSAVLACSALKEEYRTILSSRTKMIWVYLVVGFETIYDRMKNRDHYMKPEMLQSQFDTLEIPDYGIHVDASHSV
ncbi:MAG: gluconokinase, partial [Bacteroidetes bacterium]